LFIVLFLFTLALRVLAGVETLYKFACLGLVHVEEDEVLATLVLLAEAFDVCLHFLFYELATLDFLLLSGYGRLLFVK
jgi:hypothetical protein